MMRIFNKLTKRKDLKHIFVSCSVNQTECHSALLTDMCNSLFDNGRYRTNKQGLKILPVGLHAYKAIGKSTFIRGAFNHLDQGHNPALRHNIPNQTELAWAMHYNPETSLETFSYDASLGDELDLMPARNNHGIDLIEHADYSFFFRNAKDAEKLRIDIKSVEDINQRAIVMSIPQASEKEREIVLSFLPDVVCV